jgi:uncharacterized protein YcfJ
MGGKRWLVVAGLGLLATGAAQAQQYGSAAGPQFDYAEVVRVDPIIQSYDRPVQRDQCWREPVRYRTPAILGAIVGGVIGSQFGSGSGRDAATAAGALLGYSSVRDDQRRYGGGYYTGGREYTRYEQRCATNTEYFREEQVTGYDVTYRYQGRIFTTVTDYHPGERIRVAVDVRPAP